MTLKNHTMRDRYENAMNLPTESLDYRAADATNNAVAMMYLCAGSHGLKVHNDDRAENLVTAMFAFLIEANEIVEGDQK
jgi:hypothetical protein